MSERMTDERLNQLRSEYDSQYSNDYHSRNVRALLNEREALEMEWKDSWDKIAKLEAELASRPQVEPVAWCCSDLRTRRGSIDLRQPEYENGEWNCSYKSWVIGCELPELLGVRPGECNPVYLGPPITPPLPLPKPIAIAQKYAVYHVGDRVCVVEQDVCGNWGWTRYRDALGVSCFASHGLRMTKEEAMEAAAAWVAGTEGGGA